VLGGNLPGAHVSLHGEDAVDKQETMKSCATYALWQRRFGGDRGIVNDNHLEYEPLLYGVGVEVQ